MSTVAHTKVLSPDDVVAAALGTQNRQLLALADHRPGAYMTTTVCGSASTLDVQSPSAGSGGGGTATSLAGGGPMRAFDDHRLDRMQQEALENAPTSHPTHTQPQDAVSSGFSCSICLCNVWLAA